MAKLLTAQSIKSIKPGKSKKTGELIRREVADGQTKNLYLHVQPSCAKSFVLMIAARPDAKTKTGKKKQTEKLPLGPVDLTNREVSNETPKIGDTLTLADARRLAGIVKQQPYREGGGSYRSSRYPKIPDGPSASPPARASRQVPRNK